MMGMMGGGVGRVGKGGRKRFVLRINFWTKLETNTSGAIWLTILQLMQIAPSGGQICN